MKEPRPFLGLLRRRQLVVPTWRGWLVLLLACIAALILGVRGIYSFFAVNDPQPGGVLVVEGWVSDFVLREAIDEFRRDHYQELFVTGGPLDKGAPFSEFNNYAEWGAATLEKMGLESRVVHPVPAPLVVRDRTYTSAVFLKRWLDEHGMAQTKVNVISMGTHARRTRFLYEKAFGSSTKIGIVAVEETGFDPTQWWTTSQGVRGVLDEVIAYSYARLLFKPDKG